MGWGFNTPAKRFKVDSAHLPTGTSCSCVKMAKRSKVGCTGIHWWDTLRQGFITLAKWFKVGSIHLPSGTSCIFVKPAKWF